MTISTKTTKKITLSSAVIFCILAILSIVELVPRQKHKDATQRDLDATEDGVKEAQQTLDNLNAEMAYAQQNLTDAACSEAKMSDLLSQLTNGTCGAIQQANTTAAQTLAILGYPLNLPPADATIESTFYVSITVCVRENIFGRCKAYGTHQVPVILDTTTVFPGPWWLGNNAQANPSSFFNGLCGMHERRGDAASPTVTTQGARFDISGSPYTQGEIDSTKQSLRVQYVAAAGIGTDPMIKPVSGIDLPREDIATALLNSFFYVCQLALNDIQEFRFGASYYARIQTELNTTVIPDLAAKIPAAQQNVSTWVSYQDAAGARFDVARKNYEQGLLHYLLPTMLMMLVSIVSLIVWRIYELGDSTFERRRLLG